MPLGNREGEPRARSQETSPFAPPEIPSREGWWRLRVWRRLPISAPTGVGIFAMRRLAHRTHLAGFVALVASGARAPAQAGSRLAVTDDAGRRVVLAAPAARIVSLSPAITELLFALGVGPHVVGRTTWCDYPPAALALPSVGDGLNPNLEAVISRRPDLVVLYDSPANTSAADHLAALGVPALLLRQDRLEDLIHDAEVLGRLVGREAAGDSVAAAMARTLKPMPDLGIRVAILVWDNPPTVIGGESYLDELARLAGSPKRFPRPPHPGGRGVARNDRRPRSRSTHPIRRFGGVRGGWPGPTARVASDPGRPLRAYRHPPRLAVQPAVAARADGYCRIPAAPRGRPMKRGLALGAMALGRFCSPLPWDRRTSHGAGCRGSPIVRGLRVPRALLAFLVGGALGTSGAALQAIVRNPLADPFLLGLSGGAGLGAVLAIAFAAPGVWATPLAAFGGALAAMALVYRIGVAGGGELDPRILILGGVAVGAFTGALTTAVVSLADAVALRNALLWLWGGLSGASWETVAVVAAYLPVPLITLFAAARPLDLLALGEEPARYLGADVRALRRRVYVAASLLTAVAVAVSGVIGFVGLIVPHGARMLVGHRHRVLLPAAFVGGGTLLVLADTVARVVVAPRELPVGIVTALVGVPVFALLVRRWTTS